MSRSPASRFPTRRFVMEGTNQQQITKTSPEAARLREAFIRHRGLSLVDVDYGEIERRYLGGMNEIERERALAALRGEGK